MDGVLVVDKPAGMTSHDVVDKVRKRLKTRKVGHAGTLDPDATGVLILGIGRATRFLSYAQEGPKRYRAVARFGSSTSTQDASGEVIEQKPVDITRDDLERELKRFVGEIEQVPPMVSAVKVGGEALYKKALRGEEIEREARRVTIHALELLDFDEADQPAATLDVRCSAGTFIRTLIHDLGGALGCGAHMAELRRTEAGGFGLADMIPLERVSRDAMLPLLEAVRTLPRLELDEQGALDVRHGRRLPNTSGLPDGQPVAVTRDDRLLAVYIPKGDVMAADRVLSS